MNKIKAVILDWAGTTLDYGCFAPVDAFIKAFESFGISPTIDETRAPMGMSKIEHIEKMLSGKRLSELWVEIHGKPHLPENVQRIYQLFEPELFSVLHQYTEPLPGVVETIADVRDMGLKIGSTTGYTSEMMDVVMPLAEKKGYKPDSLVTPDQVSDMGRPYPYMLWRNLENLKIISARQVVKVGDTKADMEEGKNAGCICIGVVQGSSMMGLSLEEYNDMSKKERSALSKTVKQRYFTAGADYVIDDIKKLPDLLQLIDEDKEVG